MEKNKKIFLLIGAVLILTLPFYVKNLYYLHVINLAGIYALVTIGLNILSGYTGQTSMGQAGFFAIGTYVSALAMMNFDIPFFVAAILSIIVSLIFGLLISIPTMKLSGPYLVLATVGFGEIIRLVLLNWTPVTKGAAGLTGIPYPEIFGLQIKTEPQFFYLIFAFVVLGTYIAIRLTKSKVGRTLSAIREDEISTEAMGVPVDKYKIAAFAISAMFAGIAGALFGSFSGVTSPDNFTFDESVAFLCMSVIGGNKTILGGIFGAFVLTILSEYLRVFQGARLIVYGLILVLTVIYMPNGLVGIFNDLKNKKAKVQ
ncbi:branched-chain amino acid ABC transporter permease [Tissierella sp.]|uniref:branched-chain amino acid ABC transporter permease n=1 Tax=Tissierella sp. TaxID=41274 RepID=UPI00285DA6C9|nr:branched-chain amino acid ABC transporter permease [Tissierella sp.]MDR7857500.1 branched-chain amino acid ABC transporter permease [Tissierella sp.]